MTIVDRAASAEARVRLARAQLQLQLARIANRRLSGILSDDSGKAIGRASTKYGSAKVGRINDPGPRSGGGSANYQLPNQDRRAMRERCQQHNQDNPLYRTIVQRFLDVAVGDGPTFTPTSRDQEWNERVAQMYARRFAGFDVEGIGSIDVTGKLTGLGLCRSVLAALCTDGDVLAVHTDRGLQLIESERICNPMGRINTSSMIDGVKIDDYGRPLGFYVAEWSDTGSFLHMGEEMVELDSDVATLVCNPKNCPVGLVRGEPAMQASLVHLEGLRKYMSNTAKLAEVATWFGLVLESENPEATDVSIENAIKEQAEADGVPAVASSQRASGNSITDAELSPGWFLNTKVGTKATQIKPEYPTTNYREYITAGLMLAAAEMGLPFALAFFDGTQLSYAQLKSLSMAAQPGMQVWRETLDKAVLMPDYRTSVARWIAAGKIDEVEGWEDVTIEWPDMPVLDIAQEVDAYDKAVNGNYMTKAMVVARFGRGTFRAIAKQRAIERKMESDLGIAPISAPGSKVLGGVDPKADPADPIDGPIDDTVEDSPEDPAPPTPKKKPKPTTSRRSRASSRSGSRAVRHAAH